MEKRPKKSLSLKLGQKKLKLSHKAEDSESSSYQHLSSSSGFSVSSSCPDLQGIHTEAVAADIPPASLSGLCNLGNTCYANCILQVLRFSPHFCSKVTTLGQNLLQFQTAKESGDVLLSDDEMDTAESTGIDKGQTINDGGLAIHLYKLWQRMAHKEKQASTKASVLSSTKPQKFLSKLREEHEVFDNKLQQDAQELLRFVLTSLHETTQQVLKTTASLSSSLTTALDLTGDRESTTVNLNVSRKRKFPNDKCENQRILESVHRPKSTTTSMKLTNFFSPVKPHKPSPNDLSEVVFLRTENCNQLPKREHSDFIKEMFQGELVSQTRCYECDSFTRRTEPFFDISLPVSSHSLPGFPTSTSPTKSIGTNHLSSSGLVGPFSLSWALSQFCLREKLQAENKYCCENCRHLVEAEKSILFGRLPLVMTLHLNRFTTCAMYGLLSNVSVSKIGGNIAVPLSLCFRAWCTQDCPGRDRTYQLFAVVFHTGSSCSSGHYTACVRGRECISVVPPSVASWITNDYNWLHFDDEVVELVTQEELLDMLSPLTTTSTAYILFYTRN